MVPFVSGGEPPGVTDREGCAGLASMEGTRVLVTGGLGFIGSSLAHFLVPLGARVTLLDACLEPYGWNLANVREIESRVEVVRGDIRDRDLMAALVREQDLIYDCAAQVSHTLSLTDPFLDVDINCRGALTVLESVRQVRPSARLVYVSTRGVIGRRAYSPVDEVHPTEPADLNGANKLAAEKYHQIYHRAHGLKNCIIRVNNTFGPRCQVRHDDYGVVNYFIRQALLREPITIHGEGHQTRDYNHVDDVSRALVLAGQKDEALGEVFFLGSGTEIRLIDILSWILEDAGWSTTVRKIPRPEERERIEIGSFGVTIDKIRRRLGWEPRISVREGIRQTVDWYRQRIDDYVDVPDRGGDTDSAVPASAAQNHRPG